MTAAMGVDQLREMLRDQLYRLDHPTYEVHEFRVWYLDEAAREVLGDALIRYEKDTWTEGFCTSETCNHWSHDPLQIGSSVFLDCSYIGQSARDNQMYRLSNGAILLYSQYSNGRHYNTGIIFQVKTGE